MVMFGCCFICSSWVWKVGCLVCSMGCEFDYLDMMVVSSFSVLGVLVLKLMLNVLVNSC